MRPANSLAAHRRLAALHTTALALGLTARRDSAETGGEGFCHGSDLLPARLFHDTTIQNSLSAFLTPPLIQADRVIGSLWRRRWLCASPQ
jgi:hypothetical protein